MTTFQRVPEFTVHWTIDRQGDVWRELLDFEPVVESALGDLLEWVPIPPSTRPFMTEGAARPTSHFRSYYLDLNALYGGGEIEGVFAIKGAEIFSSDFADFVSLHLEKRSLGRRSPIEAFPILEHKAPGAVLLDEALAEAESAQRLQQAHRRAFGELARAPVPLACLRWGDDVGSRYLADMRTRTSARAFSILERLVGRGLGAIAYYYPTIPIRALHVAENSAAESAEDHIKELRERVEPETTIRDWIELVARVLGIGFFPCNEANDEIGYPVRDQNAVIDGGFVDWDSLTPMSAVATDREFYSNLRITVEELSSTIEVFLAPRARRRGDPASSLYVGIVWRLLCEALAKLDQALDPRLQSLLDQQCEPSALVDVALSEPAVAKPFASGPAIL